MEERYWELFQATGSPVVYLLYRQALRSRQEDAAPQTKTAWAEKEKADV